LKLTDGKILQFLGIILIPGVKIINNLLGKKPGQVVRAEDSRPIGCGFEPRCILDGCKQALAITYTLKKRWAKWDKHTKIKLTW
jgi:hypothetical protein